MPDAVLDIAVPLIAGFEGFRSHPYQDQAGVWTIGYGNTYLPDGSRVTSSMLPVTQDQALAWLQTGVREVLAAIKIMVCVPVSDHTLAALCSFAWNEGKGALRGSTLLKKLNAGDTAGAADAFASWIYVGSRPNNGLRNRRTQERAVFLTPDTLVS
jgi:GH24 family phage-related lysozyme (muramidase)